MKKSKIALVCTLAALCLGGALASCKTKVAGGDTTGVAVSDTLKKDSTKVDTLKKDTAKAK